jgi:hypothetical protein
VESNLDVNLFFARPADAIALENTLHADRSLQRTLGIGEHGHDGIADGFHPRGRRYFR